MFSALYLRTEKSVLISVCPEAVPLSDRYEWYHTELMHSLWHHNFRNAGLLADRLASLKIDRTVSLNDNALWFYDLLILGRYSELMAMLQRSSQLEGCYYGHYLKAEALLGLHEYTSARDEFVTARSLAAEQPFLLLGLLKANLAVGNRTEAKHYLKLLHSKASARWIDAFLALIELRPYDEPAAQRISIEFIDVMSDPLDEFEAVAQLDFASDFMLDMGFERQARMLSAASTQIKQK